MSKIPTFINIHPLKIESYLKLAQFKVKYYYNKQLDRRSVTILLSLFELEDFLVYLEKNNIERTRFIVFTSYKEIALFPDLKDFLNINSGKKLNFFIPPYIEIIKFPAIWRVLDEKEPIEELDKCISLSKSVLNLKRLNHEKISE